MKIPLTIIGVMTAFVVCMVLLIPPSNEEANGEAIEEATIVSVSHGIDTGQANLQIAYTTRGKLRHVYFTEKYFEPGVVPKVGECVKIWVKTYDTGDRRPIGDRNIAPCK